LLVDLVQVTTRDGVRLDGALQTPPVGRSPALAVDAVAFLHGTGGNFYSSTLFDAFAERFLELGVAVLRVNTRGHDGISTTVTAKGGRRLGAAYEVVDDCRHDVAACLDFLRQQIGPRVGLLGHSLGAVKCLYALAQEPRIGAAYVAALSPPRLSYSWFCASPQTAEFLTIYQQAEHLMHMEQPTALLDVRLPLPFVITAAGYLEKYGPEERYNYLRFIGSVPCPVLVTLGSVEMENNMAFRGASEALAEPAARHGRLHVTTVAGADHFYTGVRREVVACVEAWLREALP
jgi:dienelactone hydrolase